jgi:hypothetical protein
LKGCLWLFLLMLGLAAGGYALLAYTPARGSIGLALLTAFLITLTLTTLWSVFLTVQQWRALQPPVTWKDGSLVGFSGRLSATAPLSAPASGVAAAIYEYSVSVRRGESRSADEDSGRRRPPGTHMSGEAFSGMAMAPCSVQGLGGSFRLIGFPLLAEVTPRYFDGAENLRRLAAHLLRSEPRPRIRGIREALAQLDALLNDEDGVVRFDCQGTAEIDLTELRSGAAEEATEALANLLRDRYAVVEERVVPQGAEVTAFGRYRARDRTINVGGATRDLTHAVKLGAGHRVATKTVLQAVAMCAISGTLTGLLVHAILVPLVKVRGIEPFENRPLSLESIVAARVRAEEGTELLVGALNDGDRQKVSFLLALGVDPNGTASGTTPLEAARDAEMLRLVLTAGADPNHTDEYGQTELHRAAQLPDAAVAEALLDAGAEPNRKDASGATPLDEARANGNGELEALLLQRGALETEVTAETGTAIELTHETVSVITEYLAALQARDIARLRLLEPQTIDWAGVEWEPFLEKRPASVAACTGYAAEGRATVRVIVPTASGAPSLTLGFQLERRFAATEAGGAWRIVRDWVEWPRRTE